MAQDILSSFHLGENISLDPAKVSFFFLSQYKLLMDYSSLDRSVTSKSFSELSLIIYIQKFYGIFPRYNLCFFIILF